MADISAQSFPIYLLCCLSLILQFGDSNGNQAADLVLCASECKSPADIAIDPTNDDLYVSDGGNNRVLRFGSVSTLSTNSSAIAVFGQPDFASNAPGGGSTGLYYPHGVFVDREGTLWVADGINNRVLWFHHASQLANGSAANGVLGQPDFSQRFSGSGATGMYSPWGLLVDIHGSLWVADSGNNRVLRFDNASTLSNGSAADGVLGQPDFVSNLPAVTPYGMYIPNRLSVAPDGSLFVTDSYNNRILLFSAEQVRSLNGSASWVFMKTTLYNNSALYPPSASSGTYPWGTAIDPLFGDLYAADLGNNRVLIYQGGLLPKQNGMPANVVLGQPDFVTNTPGNATDQMSGPIAVVLHPNNRTVWLCDWINSRVLRFSKVLLYSHDSSSLGLLLAFQGESPVARMLPKDSNGTTHPGVFQFLLQPQGIDEVNAENETVASFVFPVSGYNVSSSENVQNTQQFTFLLSVPQVQVLLEYSLFEMAQNFSSAGISFSSKPSSVKLSIVLDRWNFSAASNSLLVSFVWEAIPPITSVEMQQSEGDISTFLLLSNGQLTTTVGLLGSAEVDGASFPIGISFLGLSQLVLRLPSFRNSLTYDPEFSITIGSGPSSAGEASSGGDDLQLLALISLTVIPLSFIGLCGIILLVSWLWGRRRINRRELVNL